MMSLVESYKDFFSGIDCKLDLLEISFETSDTQGHKSLCRYKDRVVVLSREFKELPEIDQIAYIAFELYNLTKGEEFEVLIQGSASVDDLVRAVERLEHGSALQTQELVKKHFGANVDYELKHVAPNFDSFYALEQLKGHSQWIAKKYRPHETFHGTIAETVAKMMPDEHDSLYSLLHAEHHDPGRFKKLYAALTSASKEDSSWANVYQCAQTIFSSSRALS